MQSVYYTGYKKAHAIKLSVIACVMSGRILHVASAPGSCADSSVYLARQREKVAAGAFLFGDKAYEVIE